jgi:hypothetical protein
VGTGLVRRVDYATGIITTYVSLADLGVVWSIAFDGGDNLYAATGTRIYRIDAATKTRTIVAGTGDRGFSGDGGDARLAAFQGAEYIHVDPAGNIYLSDNGNFRLRKIAAATPLAVPIILQQPASANQVAGDSVTFSVQAANAAAATYQWRRNGRDIPGATRASLVLSGLSPSHAGLYTVKVRNSAGAVLSAGATLAVAAGPQIITAPVGRSAPSGGSVTFSVQAAAGESASYQWERDGVALAGANTSSLTLSAIRPADTGIYRAIVRKASGAATDLPVATGLTIVSKLLGDGTEFADITHPNGNIFDQILLEGTAASFTADAGQITRLSFIDLNDDIVQVEFSGAGTVSLVLEGSSGPALPANYHQSTRYLKGHAGIVVADADETSNLSVFSVGRATAVNQALFKDDVVYDGLADIAFVAILSRNGKFGGLRTANASYWHDHGITGVLAPGVDFSGPFYVGNIAALDDATPVLVIGSATDPQINGGDLLQPNHRAIRTTGITRLRFVEGADSHGKRFPGQANQARFEQDGVDVTDQIVGTP